ncbi:MAG: hypothetical protein M1820_010309 [Bogoriella megaspora]|nr:MAG: hypothetical protein M1820_010309 [Bogoriella megaspora]
MDSSCAIDRFLDMHGLDEKEALAYFYCSRTTSDTRQQDPKAILLSIVRQISAAVPGLPLKPPIISMYERETARGSSEASLSIDEISSLLMELIQDHYDHIILIVDALDECKIADRSLLLQTLSRLTYNHKTVVKTLVSSRNDPDIEIHFSKTPNLSITATDNANDIARYVQTSIDERLLSGKAKKQTRDQVGKALISKAGGVFRWVALQVDALCDPEKVFTEADINHLLFSLPPDLEATYARILDDLDRSYPPPSRATIRNVLKLLLCAEWPMSTRDMLGALRLLSSNRQEDLNKTKLLRMGRGLIIGARNAGDGFSFAHLSVREFLEQQLEFDAKRAHSIAAEACLRAYLLPVTSDFWWYALSHLGRHCQKSQDLRQKPQVRSLMVDFLLKTDSNTAFHCWNHNCFQTDVERSRGTCDERRRCQSRPAQPLFMASVYDFDDFAEELLEENVQALYAENFYHERPLEVAAFYGNYTTMVVLYDAAASKQKASIREDRWLLAAASSNSIDVWNFARAKALERPSNDVLFKAAGNHQHSKQMVSSLLDDVGALDEKTVAGILQSCASLQIVELITPHLAPDQLTELTLSAAAQNRFINPDLTEIILSKSKFPHISGQCIVDAALRGGRSKAAVLKLFLEHPGCCDVTEEMLCLITRLCKEQTTECLHSLFTSLPIDCITQDLLKAAAENIYDGPAILTFLLAQPGRKEISQQVLQSAMLNRWKAVELFDQLIAASERPGLLEESLYVFTETWSGDDVVLQKVMAEFKAISLTESFLKACAANRHGLEMEFVLSLPRAFPVSEEMVHASLGNFKDADGMLLYLLRVQESLRLEVSENLLLLALSNQAYALHLAEVLAEVWGCLPVTESVVMCAVRHPRSGMDIYYLLRRHSDNVDEMLTENVLRAGVEGDNVEFVEYYKRERSDFPVDENLLKAAIGPYSTNNAMLRILLLQSNRCPVSELLLHAANDVKWNNPSALELLIEHSKGIQLDRINQPKVEKNHPLLEQTRRFKASEDFEFQALLSTAIKEGELGEFSFELSTAKLDELMSDRNNPILDSSTLVEAAAGRRDGKFVVQYLLSRFPETIISHQALRSAATNEKAPTSLLDLLLRNYEDVVDSELLQLAASNQYRGTQMVELLLTYYPTNLEINRGAIAAGLRNQYCAQSILELILARQPQLDITEELVDAASENDVLGKVLLQRFLDRALTLRRSTSAELVLKRIKTTKAGLRDSLFMAACYGQDLVLDFLISRGVPLSTVSGELGTALNVAVYAGNVNVTKTLLKNGGDPESRSKQYGTALETACRKGQIEIIRLLVGHGANVDRTGDMNRTMLHIAAREGHSNVVDALLSLGASAISADCQGLSAFHHAAASSTPSTCINHLLQAGAVPNQKDLQQWTPLHWAAKAGATEAVAELLAAGADRTATDATGRAPLHIALYCGYVYLRPKLYYPEAPDLSIKPADTEQEQWWCDVCEMDIQGSRFKCDVCSDYDLCFRCILDAKVVHDPDHEFSEIEGEFD